MGVTSADSQFFKIETFSHVEVNACGTFARSQQRKFSSEVRARESEFHMDTQARKVGPGTTLRERPSRVWDESGTSRSRSQSLHREPDEPSGGQVLKCADVVVTRSGHDVGGSASKMPIIYFNLHQEKTFEYLLSNVGIRSFDSEDLVKLSKTIDWSRLHLLLIFYFRTIINLQSELHVSWHNSSKQFKQHP